MAPDSRDDDLNALIAQAEQTASRSVLRKPAERRPMGRWLWGAVLAGLTVYAVSTLWRELAPPSSQKTASDLEAVVDAARQSVEEARTQTGRLPEALPNASLASVVVYEPGTSDYRLSATIMGVRVTLQSNGQKTTETGVGQ